MKGNFHLYMTLGLIRTLTFRRVVNFMLNEGSYLISRPIRKPVMAGFPWAVSIEPTTACNLRCPECPSGQRSFTRPTGALALPDFKNVIDQLGKHLIYLTLYFQGEPFLQRDLTEMISYAKKKRIFIAASTNGHFLDDEMAKQLVLSGLDRVVISLDGTDQATYSSYRVGGDLEKVIMGIKNLTWWKKKLNKKHPLVELQFLVLRSNEHQINDIQEMAINLEADKLTLKSAQLSRHTGQTFLTSISSFARYKKDGEEDLIPKNKFPNHCHRLWHAPVITWDLQVLPCCYDKNAESRMGNLRETDFQSIWKGKPMKEFRKRVFANRNEIAICRNCGEGLKL